MDQLETKGLEENLARKGHQGSKADQDHEVELVDQGKRENRDRLDFREMLDRMD